MEADFTPPRTYRMTTRAARKLPPRASGFSTRPSRSSGNVQLFRFRWKRWRNGRTFLSKRSSVGSVAKARFSLRRSVGRPQRSGVNVIRLQLGDPAEAVRVLIDHYEAYGDRIMKVLAEQDHVPTFRQIADGGRKVHHQWCTRVFAHALTTRVGLDRRRCRAELIAICDVYVWKLLRRDAGLSRRQTELASSNCSPRSSKATRDG